MEQLTLSLEVPRASRSPSQEEERRWMASLLCASSITDLYEIFARRGFCGRTCQEYFPPEITLSDSFSGRWKNSGMACAGQRLTLNSSEWRSGAVVCSLSDTLETSDVPQRFYLSPTACAGILSRAKKSGKNLPEKLNKVLASVANKSSA